MSLEMAEKIAKAVLYEGYLLYPYTASSTKNRQRWTFGAAYPRSYVEGREGSDLAELQTECLIALSGAESARVSVRLRFLHLIAPGEEAVEREVSQEGLNLKDLSASAGIRAHFVFPGSGEWENGKSMRIQAPIQGCLEVSAERLPVTAEEPVYRLRVKASNISDRQVTARDEALLYSMISTHALLSIEGGAGGSFISLMDPPPALKDAAHQCRNIGTWPVLVGEPGSLGMMLSSPIILYDYPEVAPESPGDLFDGAEIDEILSLRILTLTDEERAQIRAGDERGKAILDRTENLSTEELLRLHGRLRELGSSPAEAVAHELRPGQRVIIHPKRSSDILDLALQGMVAVIESVEQDLEGSIHVAVTLEDDPGRDLGRLGQPGHRFYFQPDEVEPICQPL